MGSLVPRFEGGKMRDRTNEDESKRKQTVYTEIQFSRNINTDATRSIRGTIQTPATKKQANLEANCALSPHTYIPTPPPPPHTHSLV